MRGEKLPSKTQLSTLDADIHYLQQSATVCIQGGEIFHVAKGTCKGWMDEFKGGTLESVFLIPDIPIFSDTSRARQTTRTMRLINDAMRIPSSQVVEISKGIQERNVEIEIVPWPVLRSVTAMLVGMGSSSTATTVCKRGC